MAVLVLLLFSGVIAAQNEMKLVLFSEATVNSSHARCLDGTPAGYYIKKSTSRSLDWVIHLKGRIQNHLFTTRLLSAYLLQTGPNA